MEWIRIEALSLLDHNAWYLIKTNAREWGDAIEYELLKGRAIARMLNHVRGKPIWIARVTDPDV